MFCQLILLPRFIVPTLSPFKVPRPLVTYSRHLNSSIMDGKDINLSVIESAKRLAAIQAIDQDVQVGAVSFCFFRFVCFPFNFITVILTIHS